MHSVHSLPTNTPSSKISTSFFLSAIQWCLNVVPIKGEGILCSEPPIVLAESSQLPFEDVGIGNKEGLKEEEV